MFEAKLIIKALMSLVTSSSFADEHTKTAHVFEDDLVEGHEEDDERHDT